MFEPEPLEDMDAVQGDAELSPDVQAEAETAEDVPEEEKFSFDVNTDVDFNTEVIENIAAEKCFQYCNRFVECNPNVKLNMEGCKSECVDKIKKDSDYLINILCYIEEDCSKAQECLG
ncbi:MAG: hypothetical protein FJ088_14340, partial [Deltaproteobacteria bacterium]|nr:hypothetical protein [Deltaproteobacteria bacterium]